MSRCGLCGEPGCEEDCRDECPECGSKACYGGCQRGEDAGDDCLGCGVCRRCIDRTIAAAEAEREDDA